MARGMARLAYPAERHVTDHDDAMASAWLAGEGIASRDGSGHVKYRHVTLPATMAPPALRDATPDTLPSRDAPQSDAMRARAYRARIRAGRTRCTCHCGHQHWAGQHTGG